LIVRYVKGGEVLFTPTRNFFCDNSQNRRTLAFFMVGKVILSSIFMSSGKSGVTGSGVAMKKDRIFYLPNVILTG